jgi:hypothetical protein
MPGEITYYLFKKFGNGTDLGSDEIQAWPRRLIELGVPAAVISRPQVSPLENYIRLCEFFLTKGILPVIDIHPGDSTPPMRNLSEVSCLGNMHLSWIDGMASFKWDEALDTINGLGRNRMPVDLQLELSGAIPEAESLTENLGKLEFFARKYGHIQSVKLGGMYPDPTDEYRTVLVAFFESFHKACPKSIASAAPSIWADALQHRNPPFDFGSIEYKGGLDDEFSIPDEIGKASKEADKLGIGLKQRMPITLDFYRKGWFAFEIGKVLDSWIGKKQFRYYANRPGWL